MEVLIFMRVKAANVVPSFLLVAILLVLAAGCGATTKETPTKLKTEGGTITLQQLADVQPGAGRIMPLLGQRMTIAYYAAKAGKWDLASYELDELTENAEVIEKTRPEHKKDIGHFVDGSTFKQLKSDAKSKDFTAFQTSFDKTVKACNSCHKSNDHAYIQYKLPKTQPEIPYISD